MEVLPVCLTPPLHPEKPVRLWPPLAEQSRYWEGPVSQPFHGPRFPFLFTRKGVCALRVYLVPLVQYHGEW